MLKLHCSTSSSFHLLHAMSGCQGRLLGEQVFGCIHRLHASFSMSMQHPVVKAGPNHLPLAEQEISALSGSLDISLRGVGQHNGGMQCLEHDITLGCILFFSVLVLEHCMIRWLLSSGLLRLASAALCLLHGRQSSPSRHQTWAFTCVHQPGGSCGPMRAL